MTPHSTNALAEVKNGVTPHSGPDHIRGLHPFGLRATTEIQHLCSCAGNRLAMFQLTTLIMTSASAEPVAGPAYPSWS